MAAESGGQREYVVLEPFIHQVGGRSSMLCLDEVTLCKPLILQELRFYENLPDVLKPFTSEYKGNLIPQSGVVEVALSEDPDGYLTLTAHSSYEHLKNGCASSHSIKSTDSLTRARKYRMRWQKAGSIEIEPVLKEGAQLFEEHDGGKQDSFTTHNPWIVRCHNLQIQKFLSSSGSPKGNVNAQKVLFRAGVICLFETASLKDSPAKATRRQLSRRRVAQSSEVLALQICTTGYMYLPNYFKYFSKYLYSTQNTLQVPCEMIAVQLSSQFCMSFLLRLPWALQAVEQLESFRFYTSSLLILYEGKNTDGNSNESNRPPTERAYVKRPPATSSLVDVRMIDFAHSVHNPKDQGPDQGYLFGLESLIAQLQMLKQDN
ncbi:unnamed protein product [Ixodes hexagonus]